jgi:predicted  nucleic acid-binding Zn-ribbon protein
MSRAELLYRLQEVDTELDAKRRRLQEVETSLGETEELVQARDRLQQTGSAYRRWQATLQDLELKMAALENKIKGCEQRLYSGTVKNPKELASLDEELNYLRRRKSTEEDRLLEAMIGVEEHEAAWQDAQAHWETVEAVWTASQAELSEEREELLARLDALRELRAKRENAADGADLSTYEDLRRRKGGTAVARLKGDLCTCCHVEVPSSRSQQARQGERLVFCGSCGRILYGRM